MAVMMGNLYTALLRAGSTEADAQKAAEEVAGYEDKIGTLRTDMMDIKGEMKLLRWMLGFNLAMTVAIGGKLFLSH